MIGPVMIGPAGLTIGDEGEIATTVGGDVVPGDVGRAGVSGAAPGVTAVTAGRSGVVLGVVVVVPEAGFVVIARACLIGFVGLVALVGLAGLAGLEGVRFRPSGFLRSRGDLAMSFPPANGRRLRGPDPSQSYRVEVARPMFLARWGKTGQELLSEHQQLRKGASGRRPLSMLTRGIISPCHRDNWWITMFAHSP
jgi:hypothetical protein